MTVALDAAGTDLSTTTAGSSISYTGITVGSGSNRGLVFVICFDTGTITAPTAKWDNGGTNQSMTLLKLQAGGNGAVAIFGLAAPTSGAKTLSCSWSTSTSQSSAAAISFTGVNQTGGTTSFPNAVAATGTAATQTVTVTSATGNMVVAGHTNNVTTNTVNNTQIFIDHALSASDNAANYASGAATVAMTSNNSGTGSWASVGTDILAAAGGAAFIAAANKPVLQAVKRAAYW